MTYGMHTQIQCNFIARKADECHITRTMKKTVV